MEAAAYDWMKNLAVYYILLCTVVNLAPDGKYTRYLRYFMGLFLITMVSTPLLSLFGNAGELAESFRRNVLEAELEQADFLKEDVQEGYLLKGYQEEIGMVLAKELTGLLEEPVQVQVTLTGKEPVEIEKVEILLEGEQEEAREQTVAESLGRTYGIEKSKLSFTYKKSGDKAMAGSASDGDAAGSDRSTHR